MTLFFSTKPSCPPSIEFSPFSNSDMSVRLVKKSKISSLSFFLSLSFTVGCSPVELLFLSLCPQHALLVACLVLLAQGRLRRGEGHPAGPAAAAAATPLLNARHDCSSAEDPPDATASLAVVLHLLALVSMASASGLTTTASMASRSAPRRE